MDIVKWKVCGQFALIKDTQWCLLCEYEKLVAKDEKGIRRNNKDAK